MNDFLIIHLYSNGDCLYATALARQLKNDFPGCRITWAISPFCSAILINNPFVDEIWKVEYMTDRKIETFRDNRQRLFSEAEVKGFDRIFFTQLIEENMKFYDGLVRSSIFSASRYAINGSIQPVLELTEEEKKKVDDFAEKNKLAKDSFVILFESAPQSGQLAMTNERAFDLSKKIMATNPQCRVILSSQNAISSDLSSIIDGSSLSLRETAYLTNYCNLLIGCSSGITWSGTSTAAKPIPSIQLLDKNAYIFNSPVIDHKRFNLNYDRWLELYKFNDDLILDCVGTIIKDDFAKAKKIYGQSSGQTFRLFRGIIHRFLQEGKFTAIGFFLRNNYKIHGLNLKMTASILKGFVFFPVQYILNSVKRKG